MIQKSHTFPKIMNMLSDALLTLLAYYAAVGLRFEVLDGVESVPMTQGRVMLVIVLYCFAVVFGYFCFNLYGRHQYIRRGTGVATILSVTAAGVLLLIAVFFLLRIIDFSRWTLAFFWLFSCVFLIAKHELVTQIAARLARDGRNLRHVAVVGDGFLAHQFMRDTEKYPEMGVVVDGYISAVEKPELGRRLGSYEELSEVLEEYHIDCLVVALEAHETVFMRDILTIAEKEGTRIELIPFYNEYMPTHPAIEVIGSTKMINLRSTPLDSIGWACVKRAMDIVGSSLIILLTSPLMLLTAIGVKLSSPGPIFFKQERVGKDKKPFQMLKFRSMRTDIDHTGWSTDSDPRKTKFGSFIRKFSIDELPQTFNVLVGQMSLVGPRPELPRYVRQFKEDVPLYLVRQQIRPGMTGWAQIHGLRGDTSIEDRVKYDIWYIENWSFILDIKILLKTVFGGFMNTEKLQTAADPAATEAPEAEAAAAEEKEETAAAL